MGWGAERGTDPAVLPSGLTRLGPLVAYGYGWPEEGSDPSELVVWHFCDHHVWEASDERMAEIYGARAFWVPATVGAHTLVTREPLHLEPSVYWPGCCDLHGFIRDGAWVPA